MKLAIGFITYNEISSKYLGDFLPSLQAATEFLEPTTCQILVFDNSDGEGLNNNRSLLKSFKDENSNLEYFSLGHNLGYSRAYNILINQALKLGVEYFLMLNPDMLIEPDAIKFLVQALDEDKALASVAPKILRWDFSAKTKTKYLDSAGLILKSGLRFKDLGQGEEDSGQFDRALILGPSGAAGLFRLKALENIRQGKEYFDESFFMYREDCDLAYRLSMAGWDSKLISSAIFYHDRTAASSGRGLWRAVKDRRHKSRQVRSWSHLNQHIIYLKYWKSQNFVNRFLILVRVFLILIFSLILEQFNLKNYFILLKKKKILTNIK